MSLDDVLSYLKQQPTAQCASPIDAVIGLPYPEDYLEFLTKMNGFQWEGLFLQGLPLQEDQRLTGKMLYIGYSSDGVIYVYHLHRKCYLELDKQSLDEFEQFDDFFEMLSALVKEKRELLTELGIDN